MFLHFPLAKCGSTCFVELDLSSIADLVNQDTQLIAPVTKFNIIIVRNTFGKLIYQLLVTKCGLKAQWDDVPVWYCCRK